MTLPSLPADKAGHAIAGAIVSCLPLAVGGPWWLPALASLTAGLLKEVYDSFHRDRHTVDAWDAIATTAGALPVTLALLSV
jgi:hypothetical protein